MDAGLPVNIIRIYLFYETKSVGRWTLTHLRKKIKTMHSALSKLFIARLKIF